MSIWESVMIYLRDSWRGFLSVCCSDVEMQAFVILVVIFVIEVIIGIKFVDSLFK